MTCYRGAVSAAEEGRDQCPTAEHSVPHHLSKDCQFAEGQAPAKPHLTDGKTAAANEAATVCQEDPLKSTMSLNGSFSFVRSESYCSALKNLCSMTKCFQDMKTKVHC